jgi:hypothetical protein
LRVHETRNIKAPCCSSRFVCLAQFFLSVLDLDSVVEDSLGRESRLGISIWLVVLHTIVHVIAQRICFGRWQGKCVARGSVTAPAGQQPGTPFAPSLFDHFNCAATIDTRHPILPFAGWHFVICFGHLASLSRARACPPLSVVQGLSSNHPTAIGAAVIAHPSSSTPPRQRHWQNVLLLRENSRKDKHDRSCEAGERPCHETGGAAGGRKGR